MTQKEFEERTGLKLTNDLSDDNAMLEFAVIGLECDILKLSFLGRIKG